MGTVVQTGAEIDRLMEDTGRSSDLLLDTGHATWGGSDPAALARKYKIAHRPFPRQGRAPGGARRSRQEGLVVPR